MAGFDRDGVADASDVPCFGLRLRGKWAFRDVAGEFSSDRGARTWRKASEVPTREESPARRGMRTVSPA